VGVDFGATRIFSDITFTVAARDLESIALTDVLNAVRDERQYATWLLWRARTEPAADAIADTVEAAVRERIAGMTLRELAGRAGT
jgi:hypothetical protein